MALRTPPSWLQNSSHPAENDRLTTQAVVSGSGYIGSGSLLVSANGTPNMTVNVALGWGAIVSSTSNAGVYTFYNDATTSQVITTADVTNPRIDRVVVTVNDAAYSGSTNNVTFTVVAGTPAASPSAPATPSNSISLATIAVAANATSIVAGNITDTRSLASSNLVTGLALPLAGGTLTGGVTVAPGTASVTPIKLQSSATFNSPVVGGSIEYDGITPYITPISAGTGGRAELVARHIYALSAARTLTAGVVTTQSMFGVGLPLAGSTTYEIEIDAVISVTTNSVTACNVSSILSFSVSPTSSLAFIMSGALAVNTNVYTGSPLSATAFTSTTSAAQTVNASIKMLVRTAGATTFTPQIALGNTNTTSFSINSGSRVKVTPIGSSTVTTIGAWA